VPAPAVPPGAAVVGPQASPVKRIAAAPKRAAIIELWRSIGPPWSYSSGQTEKSSSGGVIVDFAARPVVIKT
jgi:hypothetical protein